MSKKKMSFTKYCHACGVEKDHRRLCIDIRDMKTYCKSVSDCKNPTNHILHNSNGADTVVDCNIEEVEKAVLNYYDEETSEQLFKLLGKVAAARLNPRQSLFVLKYMKAHKIDNLNQFLTELVDEKMREVF